MTVHVTFPGLDTGQAATVVATTAGRVLARAAATPGSDGTATVTLTIGHLTPAEPVTVTARAPHQTCQATLAPAARSSQPSPATHTDTHPAGLIYELSRLGSPTGWAGPWKRRTRKQMSRCRRRM